MSDARPSERGSGNNVGLVGLGIALGLALVAAAAILSNSFLAARSADQALEVKGFAEREIESDLAGWRGEFTTRDATLEAAHATLTAQRARVVALLTEAGVPDDARSLAPVRTQILFVHDVQGRVTNKIEGYALTQQVSITSRDIDLVLGAAAATDSLIREGIEFSSHSPEFFYTKLGELKIDMLRDATADGRRRAETLASAGGGELDRLVSARQGVFQITPANSNEVSDYGRNDTSTRTKSIKAVVTLRYALGN